MDNLVEKLSSYGVIPVVAVDDVDQSLRLAEALSEGGLPVVEITFRTPAAAESIAAVRKHFPNVFVGAGTLLLVDHVKRAQDAGAHFGVAPGFNPEVVKFAREHSLPFVPGVCTPSEVEQAMAHDLTFFKLFPAELSGGVKLLDTLRAPYPMARFMPTGGVTELLLSDYLSRANVVACGGTWIAPSDLLRSNAFDEILKRVKSAVATSSAVNKKIVSKG
jgi:2-dehydro-3-deoxyphosphogluconate aldolase/(4S)-4-hydroxy-2-oxoglutarate aldolase